MMADRLLVGMDGGNSKTALILARDDGEVLARVLGRGTNPLRDGLEPTAYRLSQLARSALAQAGLDTATPISVAACYLANVDLQEEEVEMHDALARLGVAAEIEVRNDTVAVLKAGSERGWGVAVVAGAGINAAGLRPDGSQERYLGIGPLSGDWGGGKWIAVSGIGAAVRAADGRGPATLLSERVAEFFGVDAETVAIEANRETISEQQVIDFAPIVFATAGDDDPVAAAIVDSMSDEVVTMTVTLLRRMDVLDADVDVVLGGGTLQGGHARLLDRVDHGIHAAAPKARISVLDVPPVCGAVVGALQFAGASPASISTVREALRTAAPVGP
jgi:N-acetylglucosamine kinase-like BadF-type ATPase